MEIFLSEGDYTHVEALEPRDLTPVGGDKLCATAADVEYEGFFFSPPLQCREDALKRQ